MCACFLGGLGGDAKLGGDGGAGLNLGGMILCTLNEYMSMSPATTVYAQIVQLI